MAAACLAASPKKAQSAYPSTGSLEPLDPAFNQLIAPGTKIEKLADGFKWSEGPVWSVAEKALLFSDVPANTVFKWQEGKGITVFLKPSGYTGASSREGEQGSNGLLLDSSGRLVLCQHGDRRVARLEKDKSFTTLAEYYLYRRLNSPNDAAYRADGELYFTDPPYGLEKGAQDIKKELIFSGVYRLDRKGDLHLLTQELACPNGIAFSPDEKTLYVANSDPEKPIWMAFDVKKDGDIDNGRVFFDAKPLTTDKKGMPDGLKVDKKGNLFATGPGGVLVLSPSGKHLGTINTGDLTANCAWGGDGSVLYMTCNGSLCRIKTLTRGK